MTDDTTTHTTHLRTLARDTIAGLPRVQQLERVLAESQQTAAKLLEWNNRLVEEVSGTYTAMDTVEFELEQVKQQLVECKAQRDALVGSVRVAVGSLSELLAEYPTSTLLAEDVRTVRDALREAIEMAKGDA